MRIPNWRYPIVAVAIGSDEVIRQCKKIALFAAAKVTLHCMRDRNFPMAIPENKSGKVSSRDYQQIGHLKTELIEFSARLGVNTFVMDIDNVFVAEPTEGFMPYLES